MIPKLPAEHLNDIFIDIDNREQPNNPKIVKTKRLFKKNESHQSENKSSTDSMSISENESNLSIDNESTDNESIENESADELNINSKEIDEDFIRKHIPQWGFSFEHFSRKKLSNVDVTNTCSIDYLLFGIWIVSKLTPMFLDNLLLHKNSSITIKKINILKKMFDYIDKIDWNNARIVWICEMIHKIPIRIGGIIKNVKTFPIDNNIKVDFFGSEYEYIIQYVAPIFQSFKLKQSCSSECKRNEKVENACELHFKKNNNEVLISFTISIGKICNLCKQEIIYDGIFDNEPEILIIECHMLLFDDLPKTTDISNRRFKFLCTTIYETNHFKGIYDINNEFFLINDMGKTITKVKKGQKYSCSTAIYYHLR
jgi:hypothetical protein